MNICSFHVTRQGVVKAVGGWVPMCCPEALPSTSSADWNCRSGTRTTFGRNCGRVRLSGPAVTMRVVPNDHASSTEEGLKAIKVMETAPAGSVIVVAVEGDKGYAVFGGTFATLAKSRRLQGFVVDGSMRSVADFQRLGLPMYARGTVSGSAGGHYRLEEVDVPIMCGGTNVSPGDIGIGDADGIAVVPKDQYTAVLAAAARLRDEKNALLPLIAKRRSYTEAVKERQAARRSIKPKGE